MRGVRVADGGRIASSAVWPLAAAHRAEPPEQRAQEDEAPPSAEGISLADSLAEQETAADADVADDAGLTLAEAFLAARKRFKVREAVIAMPLSSVFGKCLTLPAEAKADLREAASAEMESNSPFPDETLSYGCEQLAETENEIRVFAAAVPEAVSAEITAALAESRLLVARTDVAAMGLVRTMWSAIVPQEPGKRTIALLDSGAGWDLAAVDATGSAVLRGLGEISAPKEIARQVTLALLEAETGAGPREIEAIKIFSADPSAGDGFEEALSAFGPVSRETIPDPCAAISGVAARIADGSAFDITPAPWATARKNARFKRKLAIFSGAAALAWIAAVAVMVCGPVVYGSLEKDEADACRKHAAQYKTVVSLKSKVNFLQRYAERDRSALAALLAVTDAMTGDDKDDIVLTRFEYMRESSADDKKNKKAAGKSDGARSRVHITGTSGDPQSIYALRDSLATLRLAPQEPGKTEGEPLFPEVELKGEIRENRGGRQGFTIDAFFEKAEEKPAAKKQGSRGGSGKGKTGGKGGA